jgi:hypothetical protein
VHEITDLTATAAHCKDLHNVVKTCQTHKHSAMCYKYWKQGQPRECRFGLGEHRNWKTQSLTHQENYNSDVWMASWTTLMKQSLNWCNVTWAFSSWNLNLPWKLLLLYYWLHDKSSKSHVAYAALTLAIQKFEQTVSTDDPPTIRAKKLLQKCAFSMIAQQELSGQQVASYLIDLEDHFCSHDFQPMY